MQTLICFHTLSFFSPFPLLYLNLLIFACSKLNPSKLEKNEDVNMNLAHLLNILSELVEKIFMAAEILPPWEQTHLYLYTVLSCFVWGGGLIKQAVQTW